MNCLWILSTVFLSLAGGQEFVVDPLNSSAILGAWPSINCYISQPLTAGQSIEFLRIEDATSDLLGTEDGPTNEQTHNVTGQYSLVIKDVSIEDEGRYQCSLSAGGTEVRDTYLHVSDPPEPDDMELYWDDKQSVAPVNKRTELTCATPRSRPPATFRFIRDGEDISHLATYSSSSVDSYGYGSASGTIAMRLDWDDEDSHIICLADVPGGEGLVWEDIYVTLDAASVSFSRLLLAAALTLTALTIRAL